MTDGPATDDRRPLLQSALKALDEMQQRLAVAESVQSAPIAVIGMSCRFPGAADVAAFWRNLEAGVDSIGPAPSGRFGMSGADDDRYRGGFIADIDQFDPQFFGIAPREARTMDPQQRMLLEEAWTALEHAGQAPSSLHGSRTGVFVGITTSEYAKLTQSIDVGTDVYVATGAALNAASGRLSYVLGLQGPCVSVDTACSSSLVAVHLACQSLRSGESTMALACGVNALISPEPFDLFSRWGMLAPDGRCKTFDESANGFTRGEGCGVVVLKRLVDALEAGDRVVAVIRGTASNQDGRSSALSVPNGLAQERVIRTALANARVEAAEVSYVETHGTGTVLGDPIEVGALGDVYGKARDPKDPLVIGTVKTNIGHLESASGVAGLIKAILCLRHELIPRHLNFSQPSTRIDWSHANVRVPIDRVPWPRGARPRLAGVSSFGFTGTNAHVVVEEAPLPPVRAAASTAWHVLPLSARDPAALAALAAAYEQRLEAGSADLRDVCHTAGAGRAHHECRIAARADSPAALAAGLRRWRSGERTDDVFGTGHDAPVKPKIAFLFTGQGAQYANMGRGLYETSPVFKEALDRCAARMDPLVGTSLVRVLFTAPGEAGAIDETRYSQPALFALEYALAALWTSWGVTPAAVMGHSVGEFAAACVAGVLELDDACRLIVERAQLMQQASPGVMAAVFAGRERLARVLNVDEAEVALAAVNGPDSVVLSGAADAVDRARRALDRAGIESRLLNVTRAFHSPLMRSVAEPLVTAAASIAYSRPTIPIVSNVDGHFATDAARFGGDYWARHALQPVEFERGMRTLAEAGCNCFIEIGPRETLAKLGRRCIGVERRTWIASLSADGRDWRDMTAAAAQAYAAGASIDWRAVGAVAGGEIVDCPAYPFRRKRFWVDGSHGGKPSAAPVQRHDGHPLLGSRIDLATDADRSVWQSEIDLDRLPYLRDHRVQGVAVVPATAYVEMAFAAAAELGAALPLRIIESVNEKPMVLGESANRLVQLTLRNRGSAGWAYEVHSRDAAGGEWLRHTSGNVTRLAEEAPPSADVEAVRSRCTELVAGADFYSRLAAKGNDWGPCFRGVAELWRGAGEAVARIDAPPEVAADLSAYVLHPALADACGHVLVGTESLERSSDAKGGALVGGGIREARLYARPRGRALWATARTANVAEGERNELVGDVRVSDADGRILAETLGARLWYFDDRKHAVGELFYKTEWESRASAGRIESSGPWLIFADDEPVRAAFERESAKHGVSLIVAARGPSLRKVAAGRYELRPDSAADIGALLDDVAAEAGAPTVALLLWPAAARGDGSSADALLDAQAVGSGFLMTLVQQLAMRPSARTAVWVVTRGAQGVDASGVSDPVHAPLWGLARSVAAEHAELWGGIVDLDHRADPDVDAAALHAAIAARDGDDCAAVRQGVRLVPRLRRFRPAGTRLDTRCAGEGAYIVTGGLGGIGLEVARWLAQRGARHLVLLGRTVPPPRGEWPSLEAGRWSRAIETIVELEAMGTRVTVCAVDVASRPAFAAAIESIGGAGAVRGVVHAAGVMQYEPLVRQTSDTLRALLAPKVAGAWNLHEVLADAPLEFFVLFSSTAAILNSPLMGAYAAANAFLDSLAAYRRRSGATALSISWGSWSGVGMLTRFAQADGSSVLRGIGTIDSSEGLDCLGAALAEPAAHLTVMRLDWEYWARLYPSYIAAPYLGDVRPEHAAANGAEDDGGAAAIRSASHADALPAILNYLQLRVARVLEVERDELKPTSTLSALGLDSLMAIELKNRIEKELGAVVPTVELLQGPSLEQLARMIHERLGTVPAQAARGFAATVPAGVEEWEEGAL